MSFMVTLFMTLIPGLGHVAHRHGVESRRDITIHQGRLSVHLQEADVGGVLTAVGQQAGITIQGDRHPGRRVSAQFSGMPLSEGLRRLPRLASLSSTMVYTRGPTGAVVLTALHVFEEAAGPATHPQLAAEPSAEDRREEAGQSFTEALPQLSSAVPPPTAVAEHDGAERFCTLLESAQHELPPPKSVHTRLAQ